MTDKSNIIETNFRRAAYVAVFCGLMLMVFKALPLLERTVVVLENMDKRIEKAYEAVSPLGRETIDKGVDAIKNINGEDVGNNITDAIRRKLEKVK